MLNDPGRVALVTGAAGGLGRAMAIGLARAGYRVAACCRSDPEALMRDLAHEAEAARNSQVQPFQADIAGSQSCRDAVDAVVSHYGRIDILVNNAAIGMDRITPHIHDNPHRFYEIPEAFWQETFDVNVLGTFRMTRLIAPLLVEHGWGRIVNVTTNLGTMVRAGFSPYGPSKAAVEAASAIWAKELAGTGVTVNVLMPGGPADTRMIPIADRADRAALVPPAAMVPPLLHLVSEAADAVTGQRFNARQWRTDLAPAEAARLAGAPAAWV